MTPLYADIRTGSREHGALREWIAARRRENLSALASVHCEPRDSDIYRGRIAELSELEQALTVPPLPGETTE